jgi:SNF2 family DNA or RNA helicase
MRLNKDLNTSQLPSFNTNNTNISLFISNENGIKNEPYVNNLSTPNLETNDSNLKVETTANSEMLTTFKEESKCSNLNLNNTNDSSDQSICIIEEDSFTPKRKNSNLNNSSYQQQQRSEIEDLTTNDDDDVIIEEIDNSDDCVIISESDHQQEEQSIKKRMLRGMHMNDDLNVPDQNGQVLVNVNHPPEDIDIYLNAFISRNIKSHQIGGIRFMYDNIVESLTRIKDKSVGFGCILAHAMGLGKTLQIVSFVEIFLRCTCAKRVLCIVPINTIQNWLNEFNYWLPENGQQKLDNDTIINYGRPFKVHLINDFSKTHKQRAEIIIEWTNNGGVLLIGYEMFRTLVTLKSNGSYTPPKPNNPNKKTSKKVQLIDLDEEDQLLKNQSSKELIYFLNKSLIRSF